MDAMRPLREAQLSLVSEILHNHVKYQVPYSPESKVTIELHLQQVLTCCPTLSAKYGNYTYNNGQTTGMIKLDGTIPIRFSNAKYNIPVAIWISDGYPNQPPLTYVTPTANMVIKENHSSVDGSGMVRIAYLGQWSVERSNLVGMVEQMGQVFSMEPPLFARPARQAAPQFGPSQRFQRPAGPQPQRPSYPPVTSGAGSVQTTQGSSAAAFGASPPYKAQDGGSAQETSPVDLQAAKQQFREIVIRSLSERVRGSLKNVEQGTRPKVQGLEETHRLLQQRATEATQIIGLLQEERQTYEHNVQIMARVVAEITDWKSKTKLADGTGLSEARAEDVIVPQDPMTGQFLKAQAEDQASEDALTVLDQMLEKGVIDLETYLKQIRKVCRVQYFARALTMKIGFDTRTQ